MGDIKQQIETLSDEYADLRAQVLAGTVEKEGEEFIASLVTRQFRSTDFDLAASMLDAAVFDQIITRRKHVCVIIKPHPPRIK
jgi:hypothetical protein